MSISQKTLDNLSKKIKHQFTNSFKASSFDSIVKNDRKENEVVAPKIAMPVPQTPVVTPTEAPLY